MDAHVIAGRYRLERRLGAGEMSEVWAAQDLELDRTVAVKLLAPEADPIRFEREARAAAGLSHPNICALYDYGEDNRRRYMALEYLPGGTLEERLALGRPLPDAEAERIAWEIAAGLAHAHDRGLVHRDLKPANVLFDAEGRAKIADFGIAHVAAATGLTEAGTVLGTASYISPEQAAGEQATPASDVYAFSVILFRMLTGRLPFEAPDALTVAAMHRDRPPPPISGLRANAPPRLESLAMASLAKRPADRPTGGRALLSELRSPDETAVTTLMAAPPPASSKRKRTVLLAVAVAVLAAAGVALAVGLGSDDNGPTPTAPTSTAAGTSRPATTTSPVFAPAPSTAETTSTEETASTTTTPATTTAPTTTVPATTTTAPATTIAPPATTAATTTSIATTTAATTTTDTATTTPIPTAAVTETASPG